MTDVDRSAALAEAVRDAAADGRPLRIRGGDSRRHWLPAGAACQEATPLDVSEHRGIVGFAPSELVVTARCGTPLTELEAVLAEAGQMLPFEPPRTGRASTFGGAIATGLSGPCRPFTGAVRDAVLGVRLIDGGGRSGRFGGEVMKNVAGYDVSRLVTGAFGTLGVVLEASVRIRALPQREETRTLEMGPDRALETMVALARRPLPLTGLAWVDGVLHVRFAGTDAGVTAATTTLGGEPDADGPDFWRRLRDLELEHFAAADGDLWCLSLPATAPQPDLPANWLLDWGGARRWCLTDARPARVLEVAAALGGHALRLRPDVLRSPSAPGVAALEARVRRAMDPAGILNPGAMTGC
jgi:glycolate oxidase FAD binding subunit